MQVEEPCPAESHFWHLCIRPAGQGNVVQEPLLKLKHVCVPADVRADEDEEEALDLDVFKDE